MRTTQRYIFEQVAKRELSLDLAKRMIEELQELAESEEDHVAIIGVAGRYPGSDNIERFWENISNGENSITSFPTQRREDINEILENPILSLAFYKQALAEGMNVDEVYGTGGFLERIDMFDAEFFAIPSKEAKYIEPHQRLMLETVYEALEDAGYGGTTLYGTRTGVFIRVATIRTCPSIN